MLERVPITDIAITREGRDLAGVETERLRANMEC